MVVLYSLKVKTVHSTTLFSLTIPLTMMEVLLNGEETMVQYII